MSSTLEELQDGIQRNRTVMHDFLDMYAGHISKEQSLPRPDTRERRLQVHLLHILQDLDFARKCY